MLESLKDDNVLEYKKLTPEEMASRGILGRLIGVVASFASPTRNGRHYSEELWEKTFDDPIMKERIQNGVCFGELGHPLDREETDMEKVAVCMPELPKKNKDGKLTAVFDILDTPNGRILKTLCEYGSTLGVSSRGSGDTFMGPNGNEEVDPDSYTCQGFDIVLIPAVKTARLQYVTESLNNKKSLTESLKEMVDSASEEDKKVMEETISNLELNDSYNGDFHVIIEYNNGKVYEQTVSNDFWHDVLYPSLEKNDDVIHYTAEKIQTAVSEAYYGMHNYKFSVNAYPNGRNILLGGSDTTEGAEKIAINQAQQVFENPWMTDKEKYDYIKTIYIVDDENEEEANTIEFDNYTDELLSELSSRESFNETLFRNNLIDTDYDDSGKPWSEAKKDIIEKYKKKGFKNIEVIKVKTDTPGLKSYQVFGDKSLEENSTESSYIDEESDDKAVVDNEAMFEELQNALKQKQVLEQKIIELNEKLSVCYAKDEKSEGQINTLKQQVSKLSESSNQVVALKTKVSKLEESLNSKDKEIEKLNQRINTNVNARKSLTEDVNSKTDKINSLNEQLKTSSDEIKKLNEQIADLNKDLQLNKSSYSKKLEKSNQLVEKYKKITTSVVNRYIDSQALKLGVSSNEIKNKLPESYNIDDIDAICEDLQSYKLNMSKLPFSTMQLGENMKMNVRSSKKEAILPKSAGDDFVDEQLLSLIMDK